MKLIILIYKNILQLEFTDYLVNDCFETRLYYIYQINVVFQKFLFPVQKTNYLT